MSEPEVTDQEWATNIFHDILADCQERSCVAYILEKLKQAREEGKMQQREEITEACEIRVAALEGDLSRSRRAALAEAARACAGVAKRYDDRVIGAGMDASYWSGGEEAAQKCEEEVRALMDQPNAAERIYRGCIHMEADPNPHPDVTTFALCGAVNHTVWTRVWRNVNCSGCLARRSTE